MTVTRTDRCSHCGLWLPGSDRKESAHGGRRLGPRLEQGGKRFCRCRDLRTREWEVAQLCGGLD
jgi:hypothetical protein